MTVRQPDYRVKREDLKYSRILDNVFAVHRQPGCPSNACIEEVDGFLRCWACHNPLNDRAARFVRKNFVKTDNGAFIVER